MIKEYRPSELYASQWFNLIINQALEISEENDIGAKITLIELIDNNYKIIEQFVNEEVIQQFVNKLAQEKNNINVKLLRACCICDGAPMIYHQAKISEILFNLNGADEQQSSPEKIQLEPGHRSSGSTVLFRIMAAEDGDILI